MTQLVMNLKSWVFSSFPGPYDCGGLIMELAGQIINYIELKKKHCVWTIVMTIGH
jgi:hypothetical protein